MRFCIPCHAEYLTGPSVCPECGARTVDQDQRDLWFSLRDDLSHEEFVPIHVLDGPVDRAILTEILIDHRVPHVVHGPTDDPLGPAYRPGQGWGVILVAEDSVDKARELVRQYERSVVVEYDPSGDAAANDGADEA